MTTSDEHGAHPVAPRPVTEVRTEPARPVVREHHETHDHHDNDDHPREAEVARRDLVRWGPIWAGLVVALSTFLLLELLFYSLGWLSLRQGEPGSTAGLVSGLIGFFSFFLGGLVAGATAMWRSAKDGLLQGILVWALTTIGIIFLTLFGGGALFGSAAEVLTQFSAFQRADLPDVDATEAMSTVRDAARWAVLGLVLSLFAAAVGGAAGGKMWPAKRDDDDHHASVRH